MAENNIVTFDSFDKAYVFGLSRGVAHYAVIQRDAHTGKSVYGLAGKKQKDGTIAVAEHLYEQGVNTTTATFTFASMVLASIVKKSMKAKDVKKNLFFVLPDDAAIRAREAEKAMSQFETIDEVIEKVTNKNWGVDKKTGEIRTMSDDMKEACRLWITAYAVAIENGFNIGVMKHTNLNYWEVIPVDRKNPTDELDELAGKEITVENGTIEGVDGWRAERRVSGAFTLEKGKANAKRWYVPRLGQGASITSLRNADKLVRDSLPREEEATLVEGGILIA